MRRVPVWTQVAVFGLLLESAAGAAFAAPRTVRRVEPSTEYRQDGRFARSVRLRPGQYDLLQTVQLVGEVTGIPVLDPTAGAKRPVPRPPEALTLPFSLAARPVAVYSREMSGRDLMDALAGALGAAWYRVDGAWLLTDTPDSAWFQILDESAKDRYLEEFLARCLDLTPQQYHLLRARGALLPSDLTPGQRHNWRAWVGLKALVHNDIAPEAADLQSVSLTFERRTMSGFQSSGDAAPSPPSVVEEVTFHLPTSEGTADSYASVDTRFLKVGRLASTRVPPAQRVLPESRARSHSPDTARLENDPKLSVTIRQTRRNVYGAAETVANATGASLVLSTNLNRRIVTRLDPRLVGRPDFKEASAWDVLAAIEKITGGVWRRAGGGYYLDTEPMVERAAMLKPPYEALWRDAAFSAFQQRLYGRPRERLRSTGTLRPEQMSEEQRSALRRAAAIAFGTVNPITSAYSAEALDLRGVHLKLLPVNREKGLPQRVQYLFPGLGTGEKSIGDKIAATLPF